MPEITRRIDGEEVVLNDVFGGLVQLSLRYGPELLNEIHKQDSLEFSDDARVVSIQTELDSEDDRELDWVVQDGDDFFGYESKLGKSLTQPQLVDEMNDLLRRTPNPTLIVITNEVVRPTKRLSSARQELGDSGTIRWRSWHSVAKTVYDIDDESLPEAHQPLHQLLCSMFERENYSPTFSGIESLNVSDEFFTQREQALVALQNAILPLLDEELSQAWPTLRSYSVTPRGSDDQFKKTYRSLTPRWVSFGYLVSNRTRNRSNKKTAVALLASLHRDDFRAVLDINADVATGNGGLEKRALQDNHDELVTLVEDYNYNVWTSYNCWGHERQPIDELSLSEFSSLLNDPEQLGTGNSKRVLVGRQLRAEDHDSEQFVSAVATTLNKLRMEFVEESTMFNDVFTDHNTN